MSIDLMESRCILYLSDQVDKFTNRYKLCGTFSRLGTKCLKNQGETNVETIR